MNVGNKILEKCERGLVKVMMERQRFWDRDEEILNQKSEDEVLILEVQESKSLNQEEIQIVLEKKSGDHLEDVLHCDGCDFKAMSQGEISRHITTRHGLHQVKRSKPCEDCLLYTSPSPRD